MRVILTVKDKNEQWEEPYTLPADTDLEAWGKALVKKFNSRTRMNVLEREFVSVREAE